jgi:hypothetical protein
MSFPVGTSAQQLPQFGDVAVLVNNGTDLVYVGIRRDTLPADGFPLQPLAQLTLDPAKTYYAQAASGTQALDMLPGGTGFAPSPSQIASQIVASTLSSAIANAILTVGTRNVDSKSRVDVLTWAATIIAGGFGVASQCPVDVTGFQSFSMNINLGFHGQVMLQWYDSTGTLVASKTWETGSVDWLTTSRYSITITDNHYGETLNVYVQNLEGFNVGAASVSIRMRHSNRPVYQETVEYGSDFNSGNPGGPAAMEPVGMPAEITNADFGTLAANASTQTFEFPLQIGYAYMELTGTAASVRATYGFGLRRRMTYNLALGAGQSSASQFIILPRRPLFLVITNTTGNAGVGYNFHMTIQKGN